MFTSHLSLIQTFQLIIELFKIYTVLSGSNKILFTDLFHNYLTFLPTTAPSHNLSCMVNISKTHFTKSLSRGCCKLYTRSNITSQL